MAPLKPTDEDGVVAAVGEALEAGTALEIIGNGSKRALGRAVDSERLLDLSALYGIPLYEPEELVMTARVGTALADVTAVLDQRNQMLAFEPPDWGPLLGSAPGSATIGGTFACNLAGPRRPSAGAARDHILGIRAVTGRAELVCSGGRVVKNVTGYDMCKLLAGSYGTLVAMTELTFKVLPAPPRTRSVLVMGLDDDAAVKAMSGVLGGPYDVTAAAHLPADVASAFGISYVSDAGAAVTAFRIEGPGASVHARVEMLTGALSVHGVVEELHYHNSARFWAEIADATPFAAYPDHVVWRISVPPASGATVAAEIQSCVDAVIYYDWGGGLIWAALEAGSDGAHEIVRNAVARAGGHAMLIRAPTAIRASVPVFQPLEPGVAGLTARIKDGFDPQRILNPGRMYEGV